MWDSKRCCLSNRWNEITDFERLSNQDVSNCERYWICHSNNYIKESSNCVVVKSIGAYERLSSHPARLILGWVIELTRLPGSELLPCQAVQSRFRESFSWLWLSNVLWKRRQIDVPPTWCSVIGGVKDIAQGIMVYSVSGLPFLTMTALNRQNQRGRGESDWCYTNKCKSDSIRR